LNRRIDMAEVIGVTACPICSKEVTVKTNRNGKAGFYCGGPEGCKVQVQSSGGKSQKFIIEHSRPVKSEAVKSEEVKDDGKMGAVEQNRGGSGEQKRGSLLDRFFGADEE
jgi:hypothetical protein